MSSHLGFARQRADRSTWRAPLACLLLAAAGLSSTAHAADECPAGEDLFLTNGTIPGPLVIVDEGDIVEMTIVNKGTIPHGASIHSFAASAM